MACRSHHRARRASSSKSEPRNFGIKPTAFGRDRPKDFYIDEYPIDRDHWVEGFSTWRGGRRAPTPRAKGRSRVPPSTKALERARVQRSGKPTTTGRARRSV